MFQVVKNSSLKKYYRKYCRNSYRWINHFKNLYLDSSPKLIVLVYHHVLPNASYDPFDMTISFETFVSQITAVSKKYPIISLNEAVNQIKAGNFHRDIQVVLTFDDGYLDSYEIVFPYLKKRNIPAIFFLSTHTIEKEHFITWEQAREMSQNGMEIGSHGISHVSLSSLSPVAAVEEIWQSKKIIEENIDAACNHFAFPFGSKKDFNEELIQEVKGGGYQTCLLNIHGYNHLKLNSFCFKRIIMDEYTPINYLL